MAGARWLYRVVRKSDITTKDTKSTKFGQIIFLNLHVLRVLRGENSFPLARKLVAMGAIVVALILLAGQSPQTSFADASIRIGYPQPSGAMLPIWVMAETKLDQKYGVNKRALAKYLATSDGAILEEAYQAYRGV